MSLDWNKEDDILGHQRSFEASQIEMQAMEEERKRAASRVSSRHQPSHPLNINAMDLPLLPWLMPGMVHVPSGVEEVC